MNIKASIGYLFLFAVVLGLVLYALHLFAQVTLLSHYREKNQNLVKSFSRSYESLENLPASEIQGALAQMNEGFARLYANRPSPVPASIVYIFNYGPDWRPVGIYSKAIQSRQVLNQVHHENLQRLPKQDFFQSAMGNVIVLRITHSLPRSGIFTTAIGIRDPVFMTQSIWATRSALSLYVTLLIFFMIILLRGKPDRSFRSSDHVVRPREGMPAFQFAGVAPMPDSPFKAREEKPVTERFFKEELLDKSTRNQKPTAASEQAPQTHTPTETKPAAANTSAVATAEKPEKNVPDPNGREARSLNEIYEYRQKLETELEELSILREIGLASNSISDADEFISTVLTIIKSKFPVDRVEIFLVDPKTPAVLNLRASIQDYKVKIEKRLEIPPENKITLDLGDEGRSLARQTALLFRVNGTEFLSAPLVDKGGLIGAIRMVSNHQDFFKERDRFILMKLAKHIAVSLNNVTLYESAVRDGLTGLYGHKHFQFLLGEELKKAERYQDNLSLALLDIDHFKKFNDTHGHQTGDYVLSEFSKLLQLNVRQTDTVFRYGGEEFAVLFIRSDKNQAREVAEKIRKVTEHTELDHNGQKLKLTVSVGVTSLDFRKVAKELFIKEADRALYHAKNQGRNQVRLFDEI
ncbi:MAG: sensor domain-containing diguanylate cyclase [Spirochaetia bacterium]|nr:sensor domain-containing diguanylate cyclase [Spirochaetia bacterium]